MKILTPNEFLDDCMEAEGLARYLPSRCHHGIRMESQCAACLNEYDQETEPCRQS